MNISKPFLDFGLKTGGYTRNTGSLSPVSITKRAMDERQGLLQNYSNNSVDTVTNNVTILDMIKSFKHKGLAELFERGSSRKVRQDLQSRSLRRLEALDIAESLTDLNVPGFNFHGLHGVPKRYSIHVNGPWSITFEWEKGDAFRVDLEQYH
jgi:toxin HigB-1